MNDRQILSRLESSTPQEFRSLLFRPTRDEERVMRMYFGTEPYQQLRKTALSARRSRAHAGNVVVLHGIMGGELTVRHEGREEKFWIHPIRMALGAVGWMRMSQKGKSLFDVRATGILKKWYGHLLLGLSSDWNLQTHWYDWRQDLNLLADELHHKINAWFGPSAPVHLVAHSMGGLVSRTYIKRHPGRWNKGGKLIMLGTPNHGAFSAMQIFTGAIDTVRKLAKLDVKHNLEELLEILSCMPGGLQMLPSPLVMPGMAKLYHTTTWNGRVPQELLDLARRHHDSLAEVVDGSRMRYIAGYNQSTCDDVHDWSQIGSTSGYTTTMAGDGTVPHRLGFLEQAGQRIPTYFVDEKHGDLPNNAKVILAVRGLLSNDRCELPPTMPQPRGLLADRRAAAAAASAAHEQAMDDACRLDEFTSRLGSRSQRGIDEQSVPFSMMEGEIQDILLRGFLGGSTARPDLPIAPRSGTGRPGVEPSTVDHPTNRSLPTLEIALIMGGIEEPPKATKNSPMVDAIAVGHYSGVAPQYAEHLLDAAISRWKPGDPEERLILSSLHRRGAIQGTLGHQFFVPDPRDPARLIVLSGMGNPGRFREPELTLMVRELVWTMGQLGRKHLASVLIGSGQGNLPTEAAVAGWLRGLKRVFSETIDGVPALRRLTFVENNPARFMLIHEALKKQTDEPKKKAHKKDPAYPVKLHYRPLPDDQLQSIEEAGEKRVKSRALDDYRARRAESAPQSDSEPSRISVQLTKDNYEYSALTTTASIPLRTVMVDPSLVDEINGQLPSPASAADLRDLGNLLGRMLLPETMREVISQPGAPVVLMVDAKTARIHFESVALSPAAGTEGFAAEEFLGTCCGLTRQLRTELAGLPEPPPFADGKLRVLVVADPAEDAPLPGAQEEGLEVARIFDEFKNRTGFDVEVVTLLGPAEATRVKVLDQLVNHRFDLLHYAGHCFFDAQEPAASGWLFSDGHVLSARELNRIDRVPRFVFSNACESGITPDRADQRAALLAPSFAEAFFARGVANFICTAWPIDDGAAVAFARRVYRGMLGLENGQPEPLHVAMREARITVANMKVDGAPVGLGTWGAYQHYGDPTFRLVSPAGASPAAKKAATPPKPKRRKRS